jgi:hypothetical protein
LISLSSAYFSSGLALGNTKIETHDITLLLSVSHAGAIPDMPPPGKNADCSTHKEGFCGEYVNLGEWT